MTNYRRHTLAGGTYFFTQVTHQHHPWLCSGIVRKSPPLYMALTSSW